MAKLGRPTKYKPEMCGRVVELMREGYSLCEVAADLNISRDTITEWRKSNKEFSVAIKRGEELSQAWWEGRGRVNLENKEFNHGLWFMNMKNRFHDDWRDKHEYHHAGDQKFSELISKIIEPSLGPPSERGKLGSFDDRENP